MNIEYLNQVYLKVMKTHPSYEDEITSLYIQALENIEDGESEPNEVELAIRDIDDIIAYART